MVIMYTAMTLPSVSGAAQQNPFGEELSARLVSLRLAIEDLMATFGDQYPDGQEYLRRLESINEESFQELQREALMAIIFGHQDIALIPWGLMRK